MSELYYSENNGESFKPFKLSEVPTLATGGIIEDNIADSFIGEISGCIGFKVRKKHTSRKYKKKHGLLRKQHKRFFKSLGKALNKMANEFKKQASVVAELNLKQTRLGELLIDNKKVAD